MAHQPAIPPWIHKLAAFTALSTLALIGLGGLVTSKGVGMSVPDWPTTYGYNMFYFPVSQWVGGIFYEHSHRLWASFVGLLTLILALAFQGSAARPWLKGFGILSMILGAFVAGFTAHKLGAGLQLLAIGGLAVFGSRFWPAELNAPRWLRRLALASLIVVIVQGVLGGLRVVLYKDQIGIFHAALAQAFLVMLCALAFYSRPHRVLSPAISTPNPTASPGLHRLLWVVSALVFLQLILGASMRHQHAGLAVPDFPKAYGTWWPATDPASIDRINRQRLDIRDHNPITAAHIQVHMAHRVGALVVLVAVIAAAVRIRRSLGPDHPITRRSLVLVGLVLFQGLLGALTVWKNKPADIATLHVVVGAMTLAGYTLLALKAAQISVEPRASIVHSRQRREAGGSGLADPSVTPAS